MFASRFPYKDIYYEYKWIESLEDIINIYLGIDDELRELRLRWFCYVKHRPARQWRKKKKKFFADLCPMRKNEYIERDMNKSSKIR